MIKTLVLIGISISVAITLLQAFLYTKVAHADPVADGAKIVLPAPETDGKLSFEKALATRRSKREWTTEPLRLAQVGQLCWAAQGITEAASGKRTAPSARGVYPLQLFLTKSDGVYQYLPQGHALQRLTSEDRRVALGDACQGQPQVKTAALAFVIAADFGLAEQKLGGAKHMVYLEMGHVAQNVLLQSVALGLGAVPVGAGREADMSKALNLPANLTPVYVVAVGHPK